MIWSSNYDADNQHSQSERRGGKDHHGRQSFRSPGHAEKKKVLLVDCDSQANATTGLGVEKPSLSASLYHGLIGESEVEDLLMPTMLPGLTLLPANVDLIGFEIEMVSAPQREARLKALLRPWQTGLIMCLSIARRH